MATRRAFLVLSLACAAAENYCDVCAGGDMSWQVPAPDRAMAERSER